MKIRSILLLGFSLCNLSAFAQTGPGGVGNSTSNNMWYSGDGGAFTNAAGTTQATVGQQIYVWRDRSGNTRNATQATAANRPLFHRQTAAANGQPGLRFTGDLFIDGPSPGIANNSSYTYLMVFRDTSTVTGATNDGAGTFMLDRTTATNELVSLKPVTGNFYFYQKRNDAGGGLGGVTGSTTINTTIKAITMRRNYGTNYQLFHNNQQQGGNVADADGATTPPAPRIGRHATTSGGGIRGYIYEFIVYNFALNSAQMIIVNNYLAAKYNFALAVDDLYTMDDPANGNYDYEVAGIGRVDNSNTHTDARGSSIVRMTNPSALGNNRFLFWGHDNGTMTTNNTVDVDGIVIQSRLNRIWRAQKVANIGTADVSFDVTGFTSVNGAHLRLLIDRDGDGFFDNDVTPLTGTFAANTITFTGVNFQNGDRFTLGSINVSQTPLPVELLDLNALLLNDHEALITWKTATETNSSFFEIQRSSDGSDWTAIGQVIAAGFSSVYRNYLFKDYAPLSGTSYYRLNMVDQDGLNELSVIRVLENHRGSAVIAKVYPNPVCDFLKVELLGDYEIRRIELLDFDGKRIKEFNLNETSISSIDVRGLVAGTYFLVLHSSDVRLALPIVKVSK